MGNALQTIILASSVLYELTGPASAKLALYLSGSYSNALEDIVEVEKLSESGEPKRDVDLLIEQIQEIQKQLPQHTASDDEQEFTRAAEEFYESYYAMRRRPMGRH